MFWRTRAGGGVLKQLLERRLYFISLSLFLAARCVNPQFFSVICFRRNRLLLGVDQWLSNVPAPVGVVISDPNRLKFLDIFTIDPTDFFSFFCARSIFIKFWHQIFRPFFFYHFGPKRFENFCILMLGSIDPNLINSNFGAILKMELFWTQLDHLRPNWTKMV